MLSRHDRVVDLIPRYRMRLECVLGLGANVQTEPGLVYQFGLLAAVEPTATCPESRLFGQETTTAFMGTNPSKRSPTQSSNEVHCPVLNS
jgi:hypothetical protein